MPHIEEHIDIAAPPSEVFRFCHDINHRPDWDEQVTRVELLTPPPIRQGTLLRIDARYGGGSVFSWDAEYIGFQSPLAPAVRAVGSLAPWTVVLTLPGPGTTGHEVSWLVSSIDWDGVPRPGVL
jgi:hypothetical protein